MLDERYFVDFIQLYLKAYKFFYTWCLIRGKRINSIDPRDRWPSSRRYGEFFEITTVALQDQTCAKIRALFDPEKYRQDDNISVKGLIKQIGENTNIGIKLLNLCSCIAVGSCETYSNKKGVHNDKQKIRDEFRIEPCEELFDDLLQIIEEIIADNPDFKLVEYSDPRALREQYIKTIKNGIDNFFDDLVEIYNKKQNDPN